MAAIIAAGWLARAQLERPVDCFRQEHEVRVYAWEPTWLLQSGIPSRPRFRLQRYDTRDRTTGLQASSSVAGTALQLGYTYNAVSLVTGLSDHRPTHHQTFAYDELTG